MYNGNNYIPFYQNYSNQAILMFPSFNPQSYSNGIRTVENILIVIQQMCVYNRKAVEKENVKLKQLTWEKI